jgi:starch-binding outer membrane protein, SusD/RagB family
MNKNLLQVKNCYASWQITRDEWPSSFFRSNKFILAIFISILVQACAKFVETDPPSSLLTSDNVYKDDATAAAVLNNVYAQLSESTLTRGQSINCISLVTGLSSDELVLYGGFAGKIQLRDFYFYTLSAGSSSSSNSTIWTNLYARIYIVNIALERLKQSSNLSVLVKNQLSGECRFLRAFFYLNLINLYGDAPLAISSDYRINAILSRTPRTLVYQQIISDLQEAQSLLSDNYVQADAKTPGTDRVRPNKSAATALLARAYLYIGDWSNAEAQASNLISEIARFDTVPLNNVFLRNSKEAIWQLQPVNLGWNTEDAKAFILPSSGPTTSIADDSKPVYMSQYLLTAFENNDQRKSKWIGNVVVASGSASVTYFYPFKYKSATLNAPVTEYLMVLRLAEQFLIRSEARVRLNNMSGAKADLNVIRKRAGLPNTTANDQQSLLNAIFHERQVELFTEWGHRWYDLKRTARLNAMMNSVAIAKGVAWSENWGLYPIPLFDIAQNPNLTQNPGY